MVMIDNIPSIIFLWCYMFIIWGNLIHIWMKKPAERAKSWKLLFGAFFLLAFGDVFHLLPRTYLWFQYSIGHQIDIYTSPMGVSIYGIGLILTGITMTFFYLLFYLFWKEHFINRVNIPGLLNIKKRIKIFDGIAFGSVIIRNILILLPWNNYGSEPVLYLGFISFRLLTNLPLYIIGLEVLYLFLKSTRKTQSTNVVHPDITTALKRSSVWIIVSFVTYTITLLGSPAIPLLGMMMIPKTIAYLLVFYYMKKFILLNPSSMKFEKEFALAI
ncbi:hypothetical protein NEF87_003260 [Candidatus Lokiarchaeum ossiferum]|uniref:Uncharacterized protein n=1 Tax=Candidatus Lokiarchaeum ossiferum TaxID=2951803 RepID=A0ABY6HTX9_9ARCH|nr:hypothetical protein NEF87_003260 [Candidatus Lokiarchaeum sp. B-35]